MQQRSKIINVEANPITPEEMERNTVQMKEQPMKMKIVNANQKMDCIIQP